MSQAVSLAARYFNAACYLVSGIFLLVAQATHGGGGAVLFIVAIVAICYGLYVGLTRASYTIAAWTYIVPLVLIILAFAH